MVDIEPIAAEMASPGVRPNAWNSMPVHRDQPAAILFQIA
jgi:hypothetical protein